MGNFRSTAVGLALPLGSQFAAQADTDIGRSLADTDMHFVATTSLAVDIHKVNNLWESTLHKNQNPYLSCGLVRGDLFHRIPASHITTELICYCTN
jgi:hypothetical protein